MKNRGAKKRGLSKPRSETGPLFPSDRRMVDRLASLADEPALRKARNERDFQIVMRQIPTAGEKRDLANLAASIRRGEVTEEMLRAEFNTTAVADRFYIVTPLTDSVLKMRK